MDLFFFIISIIKTVFKKNKFSLEKWLTFKNKYGTLIGKKASFGFDTITVTASLLELAYKNYS